MKVLVTGGDGFIGRHVKAALEAEDHTQVVYDGTLDVCDRKMLQWWVDRVDGIINLAGVLGTAETVGRERHAAEVNVLGALNVLDAAADAGIPVVQIATGHEGQPNPYAITKQCATQLALSRARWTGQPVTVVRAFHVYGPGQKMCRPHGTSPVRKIIPSFVARALTGMPLEVHGSGEQLIDLVYVEDVARVLVDALAGPYGSLVEAGTGKPTRVLDAAHEVIDFTGSHSEIRHLPMRTGEPPDTEIVAVDPRCFDPWPHELEATVDWYRGQLP